MCIPTLTQSGLYSILLKFYFKGQAANKLADHFASMEHPIWGHRSQHIINSLLRDGWADETPTYYDVH